MTYLIFLSAAVFVGFNYVYCTKYGNPLSYEMMYLHLYGKKKWYVLLIFGMFFVSNALLFSSSVIETSGSDMQFLAFTMGISSLFGSLFSLNEESNQQNIARYVFYGVYAVSMVLYNVFFHQNWILSPISLILCALIWLLCGERSKNYKYWIVNAMYMTYLSTIL